MLLPHATGNLRIPQALSFAVFCETALVVPRIFGSAPALLGPARDQYVRPNPYGNSGS